VGRSSFAKAPEDKVRRGEGGDGCIMDTEEIKQGLIQKVRSDLF